MHRFKLINHFESDVVFLLLTLLYNVSKAVHILLKVNMKSYIDATASNSEQQ